METWQKWIAAAVLAAVTFVTWVGLEFRGDGDLLRSGPFLRSLYWTLGQDEIEVSRNMRDRLSSSPWNAEEITRVLKSEKFVCETRDGEIICSVRFNGACVNGVAVRVSGQAAAGGPKLFARRFQTNMCM